MAQEQSPPTGPGHPDIELASEKEDNSDDPQFLGINLLIGLVVMAILVLY